MSEREKQAAIGKKGYLIVEAKSAGQDPLFCPVEFVDIKKAFGRTNVLVTPIGGSGQHWVSMARIELMDV